MFKEFFKRKIAAYIRDDEHKFTHLNKPAHLTWFGHDVEETSVSIELPATITFESTDKKVIP